MKNFAQKFLKKKTPIIIGAILALFVALILIGAISNALSRGSAIKVVSAQNVFQSDENPQFIFVYKKQANIFGRLFANVSNIFKKTAKELSATVKITNAYGQEIEGLDPRIKQESSGKFAVDLDHSDYQQELLPGKYKLKFEIKDGDNVYVQEQEFVWGVLAINANKSIYLSAEARAKADLPPETAYLQIGALKDDGHTLCNAELKLEIISPGNGKVYPEIQRSGKCRRDNIVDVPDYFAYYNVGKIGKYQMKLTNLANKYEIIDSFEVKESVPFEIERTGPTRIWPPAKYEMKIKIKANQDFQGEIVETVPAAFEITDKNQNAKIKDADKNTELIVWQGKMMAGHIYDFDYTFDALDISPYLYLLGPLRLRSAAGAGQAGQAIIFEESRQWKIAADALTDGMDATDVLGELTTADGALFTKCNINDTFNNRGVGGAAGLAIDTTNHRLFVADYGNSRVLVYNLDSGNNLIDRLADNVLGQEDFYTEDNTCDADNLSIVFDLAYSSTQNYLYVVDFAHDRVLVYDVSAITDGEDALYVLGQDNNTTCSISACDAGTMVDPSHVFYDSGNSRLYVADAGHYRILVYDVSTIADGEDAQYVLGQANKTTCTATTCDASTLWGPRGISYDSGNSRLFVSDSNHVRVVVYNLAGGISDGMAASNVLGQTNLTTCSAASCTAKVMSNSQDLVYDSATSYLYVGSNNQYRVLVFDVSAITDNEDAIKVLGQTGLTTCSASSCVASGIYYPYGLDIDSGNSRLYVADYNRNRVLIFDVSTITDGEDATDVLGQLTISDGALFTKCVVNDTPNNRGFGSPYGVAIDTTNHRLFVADYSNSRVLVYNLDSGNNLIDRLADNVLGQEDFYTEDNTCDADSLNSTTGLAYDGDHNFLYVSDGAHYRVLVYDVSAITDGEGAQYVLGKANKTTCSATTCDANTTSAIYGLVYYNNYLYVADFGGRRVLVYDVSSISDGEAAQYVLGQTNKTTCTGTDCNASTTQGPYSLSYDSGNSRLYVTDYNHNRVLVYNLAGGISDGMAASNVLGQADMTTCTATTCDASTMNGPHGLAYDSGNSRLYVTDITHNRVLVYNVSEISDGEAAVNVLGQVNLTTCSATTCNASTTQSPRGFAYDSGNSRLYVVDTSHNRVLIYDFAEGGGGGASGPTDVIINSGVKIRGPMRIK